MLQEGLLLPLLMGFGLADVLCNEGSKLFRCLCHFHSFQLQGNPHFPHCFAFVHDPNLTLISIAHSPLHKGSSPDCTLDEEVVWTPDREHRFKEFVIDRYNVFCGARENICKGARLNLPEDAVVILHLSCRKISFVILKRPTTFRLLNSDAIVDSVEAAGIMSFWSDVVFRPMLRFANISIFDEPFGNFRTDELVSDSGFGIRLERIVLAIGLAAVLCSAIACYCLGSFLE